MAPAFVILLLAGVLILTAGFFVLWLVFHVLALLLKLLFLPVRLLGKLVTPRPMPSVHYADAAGCCPRPDCQSAHPPRAAFCPRCGTTLHPELPVTPWPTRITPAPRRLPVYA